MSKIKKKQIAKRKNIIQKASHLMDEVGFENLTVRMICDVANISPGVFYHYFDSKSDLIVELFSLIDNYFEENVLGRLNDDNELTNIVEFCKGFSEFVVQTGVVKSKFMNSIFPVYSSGGHHAERGRILYRELNLLITRGQEKGQITTKYNPDRLVDMILVILRGYCFDWARREGSYDLVKYTEDMMSLFLCALIPGSCDMNKSI